jgi:hypothetical protein
MKDWSTLRVMGAHWPELAVVAACMCVTIWLAAGLWRSSRGRRVLRFGESGGLSEELVLGFPFFVLFLAITIQLVLMINARLVVNYAAFVSARSASVWVPACYNGEKPNTVRLPSEEPSRNASRKAPARSDSSKLDRIRSAAVLACAPVSPSYVSWFSDYVRRAQIGSAETMTLPLPDAVQNLTGPVETSLSQLDSVFTGEGALGQAKRLLPRWYYSSLFTEVTFGGTEKASQLTVGDNGNIEVIVEHKFYLQVPYVGRILGSNYRYLLENKTHGFLSSDIYYVPIRESYTIRNEGERLYPGYCSDQGGKQ